MVQGCPICLHWQVKLALLGIGPVQLLLQLNLQADHLILGTPCTLDHTPESYETTRARWTNGCTRTELYECLSTLQLALEGCCQDATAACSWLTRCCLAPTLSRDCCSPQVSVACCLLIGRATWCTAAVSCCAQHLLAIPVGGHHNKSKWALQLPLMAVGYSSS